MKIEISDFALMVMKDCITQAVNQCEKFLLTDPEVLQTGSSFLGLRGMGETRVTDMHYMIRQTKALFEECESQLRQAIEDAEDETT